MHDGRDLSVIFERPTIRDTFRISYLANRLVLPAYDDIKRAYGLSRGEYLLLFCLSYIEELTAQDIAEMTGRPRNSISRAVHRMLDEGYLKRSPDPADGRQALLPALLVGIDCSFSRYGPNSVKKPMSDDAPGPPFIHTSSGASASRTASKVRDAAAAGASAAARRASRSSLFAATAAAKSPHETPEAAAAALQAEQEAQGEAGEARLLLQHGPPPAFAHLRSRLPTPSSKRDHFRFFVIYLLKNLVSL